MKELNDLKRIISKLTVEERKSESRIQPIDGGSKSLHRKMILFLMAHPDASEEETQIYLYGSKKAIAFKQLVYRAKEKLLYSWLSNDSIERNEQYDQRAKVLLLLRKRLIQFDVLNLRGLQKVSYKILDAIIGKSKSYEYYDLLVFAMVKRMRMSVFTTSIDEYERQYKELEHYEDCRAVYRKSEFYIKSLISHINTKTKILEHNRNLVNFIKELEGDFYRVKSLSVMNNLLILKREFADLNEQLFNAKKYSKQLIQLLSTNTFLYSHYDLGLAYLNLGISELKLFNFEEAENALKKAYNLLKIVDLNAFTVQQYAFLGFLYSGDSKSVEQYSDILCYYLYSGIITHYLAAKVRFYNACIKFIQQDYKSSYLLLNDVKALEQDKETWNIAIRILSIMNQIELENYQLADTLIENLRKHHERVKKTLPVTKRDEKIIQILTALSRHSYHFRRTFRVKSEAFILLDSLDKEYRWKILSPEMIIFHEWFKAKKDDSTYDHFKLMPVITKKYAAVHKGFVPLEEDVEIFK